MESPPNKRPPTVEIVRSGYQPSKVELKENSSIEASFEELVQTTTGPVEIRYIPWPKKRDLGESANIVEEEPFGTLV